jgi:hypothetical protein
MSASYQIVFVLKLESLKETGPKVRLNQYSLEPATTISLLCHTQSRGAGFQTDFDHATPNLGTDGRLSPEPLTGSGPNASVCRKRSNVEMRFWVAYHVIRYSDR